MRKNEEERKPRRWLRLSRRLYIPLDFIATVIESEGLTVVAKDGKMYNVPRNRVEHIRFMARREGLYETPWHRSTEEDEIEED